MGEKNRGNASLPRGCESDCTLYSKYVLQSLQQRMLLQDNSNFVSFTLLIKQEVNPKQATDTV